MLLEEETGVGVENKLDACAASASVHLNARMSIFFFVHLPQPSANCSMPASVAGRTTLRIVYTVMRPGLVEARLTCVSVDATEKITFPLIYPRCRAFHLTTSLGSCVFMSE